MVLKKNTFTFLASGSPVVEEIFEKTLTFIPAVQINHHIDEIGQQQSKKQGYILMRVGGTMRSILEDITEGTICYAKGVSEEVSRGYYQHNPVKLFVCEEIGIVEPVVLDQKCEKLGELVQDNLENEDEMEEFCNIVQEYLDNEDRDEEMQVA